MQLVFLFTGPGLGLRAALRVGLRIRSKTSQVVSFL